MHEFLTGFNSLHKSRNYNMVPLGLTLAEIVAYLQLYGASDTDDFVYFIRLLDTEYLKLWSEANATNTG